MYICPFCASENYYYSKKRKMYFCEDCDASFDEPVLSEGVRLFLSYGHDSNAELVHKIKRYLKQKGFDVWIDTSEIPAGRDWRERITDGLMGSNGVLSFMSEHSMRDPGACLDEIRIAVCLRRAYIRTILLEDESRVRPPAMIRNTQHIDMSDWREVPSYRWNKYFKSKMKELMDGLSDESLAVFNGDMEKLASWLKVSDSNTRQQKFLREQFVGRKWLAKQVNDWFVNNDNAANHPMMIYGVPGAGKSAFAANLANFNPDVFASVMFEWNNETLQDPDAVVRLLAYKLAGSLEDYRRMLLGKLKDTETAKALLEEYKGGALFDLLITDLLYCCIDEGRQRGMLIFDALDETSPYTAEMLFEKSKQLPQWISVLLTSRYDETSESRYSGAETIRLDAESKENINDIKEYFAYLLETDIDSDRVRKLADKCEGSFMYARTLGQALADGTISTEAAESLPDEMGNFYYKFFRRIFPEQAGFAESDQHAGENRRLSYRDVRPFLELVATGEDIPEQLYCKCLDIDRFELRDIRKRLQSLITMKKEQVIYDNELYRVIAFVAASGRNVNIQGLKSIVFSHKTISDWLSDRSLAGAFYIDKREGYRRLAEYSRPFYTNPVITNFLKDSVALGSMTQEERDSFITDRNLSTLCRETHAKWVVMSGLYREFESMLMNSFDKDEMSKGAASRDYHYYYSLSRIWCYADLLPEDYPIAAVHEKLRDIVELPKRYTVSRFSHRSMQVSALILSECMKSGRFNDIFDEFISGFPFDSYFRSTGSDIGETRDGWDKYELTAFAVRCLRTCDEIGYPVSKRTRETCELMKLSYSYCNGKPDMCFGPPDILTDRDFLTDICILDDEAAAAYFPEVRERRAVYNTRCLARYLVEALQIDPDHVAKCEANLADIETAGRDAIGKIRKRFKNSAEETYVRERIEIICRLTGCNDQPADEDE